MGSEDEEQAQSGRRRARRAGRRCVREEELPGGGGAMRSETFIRRWSRGGRFIFLLALLVHAWVLFLPFQLDDFTTVSLASDQVEFLWDSLSPAELAVSLDRLAGETAPPKIPPGGYLFRPTMWLTFLWDRALSGEPLQPWVFHLTSWLLNAFVCLIVWRFLRRLFGEGPAFLGALFFTIHPSGFQAQSWISARGDLLMTLFGLLAAFALLRVWRGGGMGAALLAGAGVALARGRMRRRLLRTGACLLPILMAFGLRFLYMGTFSPRYAAGSSFSLGALPRMLASLPSLVVEVLVPWNLTPDAAGAPPFLLRPAEALARLAGSGEFGGQEGAALLVLSFVFLGVLLAPRRQGFRILLGGLVFLVVALPPLFLWTDGTYTRISRTFYPLMVPLAVVVGSVFSACSGDRWRRGAAWAFGGLLLLVGMDALVHNARIDLEAGRRLRARLEGVRGILEEVGGDTWVVVIDNKYDFAGMPVLGPLVEKAVNPPFTRKRALVKHVDTDQEIIFRELLTALKRPVQVVTFADGTFKKTGPLLPAIPARLPRLLPTAGGGWRPARPLPVRAVAGLRLPLRERIGGVRLEIMADGRVFAREVLGVPGAEGKAVVLALDDDLDFLLTAILQEVRLSTTEGAKGDPLRGAPELLTSIPRLTLVSPPPGEERLLAYRDRPDFRVRGAAPGRPLRLSLYFFVGPAHYHLTCVFPPQRIRLLGGGVVVLRPEEAASQDSDYPGLTWETLPSHLETLQRDYGIGRVQVRWRVEVLGPAGRNVEARSPWGLFHLRH